MRLLSLVTVFAIALANASPALADTPCLPPDCTEFPADAGYINVRDFGAKGDGIADDTTAIKKALTASGEDMGVSFWHDRIVWFPSGTYLVSSPIMKRYKDGRYASGAILVGQSRDTVTIKLKDEAPGYSDPAHPQAVIFTTAKLLDGDPTSGGKDYAGKGEGNDAYMNFVENMTIDVGANNPSAIGIDYLANNLGAIRNVTVHADPGSGATGINLTRKWPGPALIQNVTVEGFNIGIDAANTEYGMTLDHITIDGPATIGLRNNNNVLAINDLTISDAPLAIANDAYTGLIVVNGGALTRRAAGEEAIQNKGFMNIRGVTVTGYQSALGPLTAVLDGAYWITTKLTGSEQPWSLKAEDAPPPPADPITEWKSVAAFGAIPDSGQDVTEAIRKAFDSGTSTIYFPHGTYLISDNITIPPSVERIVGMTSTIQAFPTRAETFRRDAGMFIATNMRPLTIESLAFDHSNLGDQVAVEAAGSQPIILRDILGAGVTTLSRDVNGGEAWIENTCCGKIAIAGPQGVWARQLNSEGYDTRITNNGAPLWILGIKTERQCTVLENTGGAHTEVLGGLIYITGTSADPSIPAFRNTDSSILLAYAEESFDPKAVYTIHLFNTRGGVPDKITAGQLPPRGIARMSVQLVRND